MDKITAQAIHDLATTGRLSEPALVAVSDALGLATDDEGQGDGETSEAGAGRSSGKSTSNRKS